jgi:hypothetical protein
VTLGALTVSGYGLSGGVSIPDFVWHCGERPAWKVRRVDRTWRAAEVVRAWRAAKVIRRFLAGSVVRVFGGR